MSDLLDQPDSLESFQGTVRLFPLPEVVLFPRVLQPLHMFEPRYRAMVRDALKGDRLIAMVLLRPGWETDYEGNPPVHPICCIGRIAAEQRLPGGRYNILLHGLRRARILEEYQNGAPYRTARVVLVDDVYSIQETNESHRARDQLLAWIRRVFPQETELGRHLDGLLGSDIPLGWLSDIVSYSMDLEVDQKQRLLEEVDVDARTRLVIRHLKRALSQREASAQQKVTFPPDFSTN